MKKLLVIAFAPMMFTACSSGSEEKAPSTDSIPAVNETVPSEVTVSLPDSNASVAAAASTAGVILNPPHGEPGHRCEIEVGKPLPADGKAPTITATPISSSAPTITATPATGGQPATVSTNPAVTPAPAAKTAPGMNPPHGEPGHDCSIAVGAPLKK